MNTHTNHNSPLRDITVWANSEDLPHKDLFSSIEDYRTFVHRWKALYKEVSARLRAQRICGRCNESIANKLTSHECRGIRERLAAKYAPVLSAPMSDDLRSLVEPHVPKHVVDYYKDKPNYAEITASYLRPYSSDATTMLLNRQAGKRWVKNYHPWKSTAKVA